MSLNENTLKNIFSSIKDLKFGEIIIKIQYSRIVQIERLEKFRVNKADSETREANNKICLKTNQASGGIGDE